MINDIIKSNKCPHCQTNNFILDGHDLLLIIGICNHCHAWLNRKAFIYIFPDGKTLCWDFVKNKCLFCYDLKLDNAISIPWLPFDITEKRLQELMVFI